MPTDPNPQAETEAMCSCGAKIIRVPVPSEPCFEYWRRDGTGEVCTGGHWHAPAEPSPAPQAPAHDGSEHYYAENFGLRVGKPAPQGEIPDDLIASAFEAVTSLSKENCFGDPTDAQRTMTVLKAATTYFESALTAAREERDGWKNRAEDYETVLDAIREAFGWDSTHWLVMADDAKIQLTKLREERDRLEKLVQLHNDSAVEANQRSQEYMAKYDKLVADGWDVLKKVAEERDRAQDALRKIANHSYNDESESAEEVHRIAREALKPLSDRQTEGETK